MTLHTQAKLRLTDANTRDTAIERLATYLPLEVAGYECTTESVLDVLLKAAATQQTIECVCNDLDEVVSGEAIRGYLNRQIRVDDLHELERRVNQALVAGLPKRLWKPKLQIAIDLHDEPFYGHTPELSAYTCRGPARKGTSADPRGCAVNTGYCGRNRKAQRHYYSLAYVSGLGRRGT